MKCYAGTPFFEAIEEMYKKIRVSLPAKSVEFLNEVKDRFAAPGRAPIDHGPHYDTIQKINEAILSNRTLAFTYFTLYRNKKGDRLVDPYSLRAHEGSMYLIGFCHTRKEIRAFAVHRMEKVTVTDQTFTADEEFSIDDYLSKTFNAFHGDVQKVVIRFSPAVAALIKERKYHPTQTVKDEKDGSVLLTMETGGLAEVRRWILSFGAEAEVMEPTQLRSELQTALDHAAQIYR
jgi:predicted DNA-binding transcriptional regulator YafY